VTNTGNRAGADVAQVYISEDHPRFRASAGVEGLCAGSAGAGPEPRVTVRWMLAPSPGMTKRQQLACRREFLHVHVSRSSADPQLEGKITLGRRSCCR